jgi:hypothetical protein
LIAGYPDGKVHVLVVWEPILSTDWRSPSGRTLGRIPDTRARQFWDPKHLVAQQLSRIAKEKSQSLPGCCLNKGNNWDEAILYAPTLKWSDKPIPAFWDGPVVKTIAGLERALHDLP